MELISIIIPVYNVEKYIEQCLESVCNQTYTNLEIILVNDGSTDNSGLLCDKFATKGARIKLIHKRNGGLSDARNVGTEHAKGDYIFYLDSDDYIKKNCIAVLYDSIQKYNADVVQANFYYDYPDYLLYNNKLKNKVIIYTKEEALTKLIEQQVIKNFAWGKLIRADIAKKHLFPKGKYFEDTLWMYQIIKASKKYVIVSKPMLYYLQRKTSISGSFSIRNIDQLELNAKRLKQIKKQEPSELYFKALKKFNDLILQHQFIISLKSNKLNKIEYQIILAKYIIEFGLKNQFCVRHHISNSIVLNRLNSICMNIKNIFFTKSYWITINKDENSTFK
tara:strand:- start:293 stop:1297 length:1005 start_codon:yes stop_codon:yes gene_type:complete